MKTPFNSPRDPALPPYRLRNGVAERAEIDAHEAEHRLRMGMAIERKTRDRADFDAWVGFQWGANPPVSDVQAAMWLAWQAAQS